jgi:hypothetical protein
MNSVLKSSGELFAKAKSYLSKGTTGGAELHHTEKEKSACKRHHTPGASIYESRLVCLDSHSQGARTHANILSENEDVRPHPPSSISQIVTPTGKLRQ